tara:strand:- start:56 stop:1228 length:1173 start_codon:yes stop_codon:yes gene_type:complete
MSRARELSKLANPAVFSVDSSNNVGINSLTPDARLDVVGVVSATQFFGDGSELSGITAGATLSAGSGDQRVVITSLTSGTMTAAATDAELSYNSNTNTLSATNVSIAGTLTYEDVKNIDSVGLITARTGVRITDGGLVVTAGVSTLGADLSIADKIVHTGDTDTCIRFPSDNTFSVETNGSESFRVLNDGQIYHYLYDRWYATDGTTTVGYVGRAQQLFGGGSDTDLGIAAVNSLILGSNGSAERLRFATNGAFGLGGANYGTSGQVITSNGSGSAPTWQDVAAGITTEAATPNNAVLTLDLTAAQDHKVTASGITTITCSGGTEADSHTVRIINSGITTVGFSTFFLFPSGSAPVLPTADGAISLISFTVNRVGTAGTQLLAGASLNFS